VWRARPVFTSSTFVDMQAERDHLRNFVFPELEERLRERRHHLEWVDLRLGIATASEADEAVRELRVLKVCLAEVRRSRPFLIVLLGDRYGWVPPEERIRAAAAEEGFTADVAGRSVTDLEIDYGVLSEPGQQTRSIFYFRAPLPYSDMPPEIAALYSDDYDKTAGAPDRSLRLAALKQRIRTGLPRRVRSYAAGWDPGRRRVIGLESWGRQVLEDIWAELESETAGAVPADLPWQQAERNAVLDFSEDRARDFVGRERLLAQLIGLMRSPQGSEDWGICITGEAGSGKSAIFGALNRLSGADALVLAHAAGASQRAPSVDGMMRRWIDELAVELGVGDPLPVGAAPEAVETTFASLLWQVAEYRRVVVLVDALDQFEATTRGRFATWMPRMWHPNARFIATAIAGEASEALTRKTGVREVVLAPLEAGEARDIVSGICRRYHRRFEAEVVEALLAKTGERQSAFASPLWIVLAVEELNLLDEDDFARAQRAYTGLPAQRLRALMLDLIADMPADIPGLYRSAFDHATGLFGASYTAVFLGLIAVGRGGWRESDLRALLTALTGEPWDELRFASLRRVFRGQMVQRGALGRWDFSHGQMRLAAQQRLADVDVPETVLHGAIAHHLLATSPDDPLRQTETMIHLLGSEDWTAAAAYYGAALTDAEEQGATRALCDTVLNAPDGPTAAMSGVCRLLDASDLDDQTRLLGAGRFVTQFEETIRHHVPLEARRVLIERTGQAFERSFGTNDSHAQVYLATTCDNFGDVAMARGEAQSALEAYRAAFSIKESLAAADLGSAALQDALSWSYRKIGEALSNQGQVTDALDAYRASLAIQQRLAAHEEGSRYRTYLALSHEGMGLVLFKLRRFHDALESYDASLTIRAALAIEKPGDAGLQRELSVIHSRIGDVAAVQGRMDYALQNYQAGLAVIEPVAAADPSMALFQHDLFTLQARLGTFLRERGRHAQSLDHWYAGLAVCRRFAAADGDDLRWHTDLCATFNEIGALLAERGDTDRALKAYADGLATAESLALQHPGEAKWVRHVATIYIKMGDLLLTAERPAEAFECFCFSLASWDRMINERPAGDWRRDIKIAYGMVADIARFGDVFIKDGSLDGGLMLYRYLTDITDRLSKADAADSTWASMRSSCYDRIGDALRGDGHVAQAIDSYRESLAVRAALAAVNPGDVETQRALSLLHEKIGDVLKAAGQSREAAESYRAGLAIRVATPALQPTNALLHHDIAQSHARIGEALSEQDDFSGALGSFTASREIVRRLASADPANGRYQQDLWALNMNAGGIFEHGGDLGEALASFQEALAVAEHRAVANPSLQADVLTARARIASLAVRTGSSSSTSPSPGKEKRRSWLGKLFE
jgi:tetratricopeptide (TPR) repeat protein